MKHFLYVVFWCWLAVVVGMGIREVWTRIHPVAEAPTP